MTDEIHAQFEDVFRTFSKELARYASFKLADREEVENIVANTFVRYWETVAKGETIQNPRAYLYTVAHGLIVDHYRKSARRVAFTPDFVDDMFTNEDDVDAMDTRKKHIAVLEKVNDLKDEYRDVVMLHYVEGHAVAEVATILGESENNIRVRLHRALSKLRTHFTTVE